MPTANIMYFDVGLNADGAAVVYAISDGGYLYTAVLKPVAQDMTWVKGNKPFFFTLSSPSPPKPSAQGLMKVHDNVVYFVDDPDDDGYSTLYVTQNFGNSWESYFVGRAEGGYAYDKAIFITDKFMLLGGAGTPGLLIKSLDKGKNWFPIYEQLTGIQTIYADERIVATGGYGQVSVATTAGMENPTRWRSYDQASTPAGLLDRLVKGIFFDHRTSAIYLFQEQGISHGKVSIEGDIAHITWKPPFRGIKDYEPDALACFIFGDVILQTITDNDDTDDHIGKFTTYNIHTAENNGSSDQITQTGRWNNPYAIFVYPGLTIDALKIINPLKGGEAYKLYLNDQMTLSISSNGGQEWQKITINN